MSGVFFLCLPSGAVILLNGSEWDTIASRRTDFTHLVWTLYALHHQNDHKLTLLFGGTVPANTVLR